jgi:predicted amidophosphoribosyltransferase
MLDLLFDCPGCGGASAPESFPMCRDCLASLVACPELCRECGNFCDTRNPCLLSGEYGSPIASYGARYLLAGPAYAVIRSWKARRGPALNRRILNLNGGRRVPETEAIVPIPQRRRRAWKLGGSPADQLARWLASETGVPALRCLRPAGDELRQAQLDSGARVSRELKLSVASAGLAGRTILLVDDIMTTGSTLRAAARALKDAGAREVHAFALGFRPSFQESARPAREAPGPEFVDSALRPAG